MIAAPKLYTPSGIPGDWHRRADDLARWARERLLNRTDAFGRYKARKKRDPAQPKRNVWTEKKEVPHPLLAMHFKGMDGYCLGLHAIDPEGRCRWMAFDIDAHDGDDKADPDANLKYALLVLSRLRTLGIPALLLDSNGKGGFHLLVLFNGTVSAATTYRLARGLVADCTSHGVAGVESFPKQAELSGKGLGNWLRMPGLHHTSKHWTKAWDASGGRWLEGEGAIVALLGLAGAPPELVERVAATMPDTREAKRKAKTKGKGPRAGTGAGGHASDFQIERIWSALQYLDPDDYDGWIKVGLSLTELGPQGLQLWIEWSRRSGKFVEGECEEKWASFSPDGRGIGSLIVEAKARGWSDPQLEWPTDERKPKGTTAPRIAGTIEPKTDDEPTFANFTWEEGGFDDNGEPSVKRVARGLRSMQGDLADLTIPRFGTEWPKRVGQDETLFVETPDHRPVYLDGPSRLFAYIGSMATIEWAKGTTFTPQERFYEFMRMNAEGYDAIEMVPHFPPLPRIYYMHKPVGLGDGTTIERFIRLFCPHTEMDRQLIRAMLLTLFWGGNPGSRPAFLITGPDGDRGRGIGKSTFADIVASVGQVKSVDVSPTDQITDVKTRLLSAAGRHARVARLDNVKALKLSWADLEGLITARDISGRMLFKGEGSRPNTVMWVITLNGASLSTDMAQRSIVVKLGRPVHRPEWEDEVKEFIETNRDALLADIRAALEAPGEKIETKTRWAVWEREILGRCPIANLIQDVIVERQKEVDDDDDDMLMVADYFRSVLVESNQSNRIDPETDKVFIPASVASAWYNTAMNQQLATNKATAALKGLGIPELRYSKQMSVRGWLWTGKQAGRNPKSFRMEKGIFMADAGGTNA